jgi:putative hydrolase
MNDQPVPPPGGGMPGDRESWRQLLRSLLGDEAADEAMRALDAGGFDPAALAQAAGLPQDPGAMAGILAQLQRLMSSRGSGPVNWDVATDIARKAALTGGDPIVTAAQAKQVTAALTAADLWLDAATELAPAGVGYEAWSRSTWVERTLATWKRLAEPIAGSVAQALVDALSAQGNEAFGAEATDAAAGMIRQLGGAVFGMQVGQAVGTLAREVFGSSDLGLPLLEGAGSALIPATITEYGHDLDAPADEVRHFLAVREAAHARLFAQVPWLRSHLLGAVEDYARGIAIDTERMEEAVRAIDPSDPDALREAFSGGVFALERTPAQEAALRRLETALALVEGWVEHVTAAAVAAHLPHGVPLREMLRRRRAAGGPAEQTFAALVGLELRPRRARDAAALWAIVEREDGIAARDGLWAHPDLLPTAEDLDDPAGFPGRRAAASAAESEVDAALASIFRSNDDESDAGAAEAGGSGSAVSGDEPAGDEGSS